MAEIRQRLSPSGIFLGVIVNEVRDDGVTVLPVQSVFDFTGPGVSVTSVGDHYDIAIPGIAGEVAGGDLSGTYPNPSVAAITETSGPTQLVIGAIADGEILVRSGGTLVGSPGTPPGGIAGGDLSGTYPNPQVAAVTETSGPTQLIVGAVADGEFLTRVGGTLVGATPPGSTLAGDANGPVGANEVNAITETSGPTQLTIGAIADGEFLVRSGATLVGTASVSPGGSAGGDLNGTYPNPQVSAITETSGPTQLVVGAIADGEFLTRVGGTLVSAVPPGGTLAGDVNGPAGSNEVTAITETSGPTSLTIGAVADGEVLVRSGTTLVSAAAVLDGDAAGGDLTGTYPNPTIANVPAGAVTLAGDVTGPDNATVVGAITETSGPTSLAIGAVADGQFLQRSGASIVGVAAPSGGYDTVQDEGTPLVQQATINFTGAGVTATNDGPNNRTNVVITGAGGASAFLETYEAALTSGFRSFVGPPGDTIGAIVIIGQMATINGLQGLCGQTGSASARFAVYDSAGNRVGSATPATPNVVGLVSGTFAAPLVLMPGVYYFALFSNGGSRWAVSLPGVAGAGLFAIAWEDTNNEVPASVPLGTAANESIWVRAF